MLIKFTSGGQGGGGTIATYLIDREREGRDMIPPEILRGDMDRTRELIDSIERKWSYTHGVVSFALEDAPSKAQQQEVMDELERLAFAGMDPEQYDITWVRHRHTAGRRVELHFVTPRMELTTGKALNIAPPGWERSYAHLRDALNHKYGWARPNDPKRARELHRAPERGSERFTLREGREAIHGYLTALVAAGKVTNRSEIIRALEDVGITVPRAGKDYLTVRDLSSGTRFRLKGRIYEKDWSYDEELDRATARAIGAAKDGDRGIDLERAAEARRELETCIKRRSAFHADCYPRHSQSDQERDWNGQDIRPVVVDRSAHDLAGDRGLLRLALADTEKSGDRTLSDLRVQGAELSIVTGRNAGDNLPERGGRSVSLCRAVGGKITHEPDDAIRESPADAIGRFVSRVRNLASAVEERLPRLIRSVREYWSARGRDRETAEGFDRALKRFGSSLDRADEQNIALGGCRKQVAERTKALTRERDYSRGIDYGR